MLRVLQNPYLQKFTDLSNHLQNGGKLSDEWQAPYEHTVAGITFKRLPITIYDEDVFYDRLEAVSKEGSVRAYFKTQMIYDQNRQLKTDKILSSYTVDINGIWMLASLPEPTAKITQAFTSLEQWYDLLSWELYLLFFISSSSPE